MTRYQLQVVSSRLDWGHRTGLDRTGQSNGKNSRSTMVQHGEFSVPFSDQNQGVKSQDSQDSRPITIIAQTQARVAVTVSNSDSVQNRLQ